MRLTSDRFLAGHTSRPNMMKISKRWQEIVRLPLQVSLFVLLGANAAAADAQSHVVTCGDIKQAYFLSSPDPQISLPAIVLLHGAGDQPGNMIEAWRRLAAKQKIVLLAPQLPRDPKFEDAAPHVFHCVVEDAKQFARIDAQRVYIFGNSMGGYLAYDGAMFESQYFAAVAVHAMRIADEYTWIVGKAQRKIPIAIYIGDHDQFFSVDSLHKTRDLLRKQGFPVHYVEFINHDHNYYDKSDEVNADAWKFFRDNRLPVAQP